MVDESPEVMDLSDLPDLPDLESVEFKTEVTRQGNIIACAFIVIFMLFFSALFTWMAFSSRDLFREDTPFVIFAVSVTFIFLLINYFLIRSLLTRHYYWKTDPEGLTIGGLFHDRFISWESIEDAEMIMRRKLILVFTTPQGKLLIYYGALGSLHLYLSIWQHLRRHGKAEKLPFPPSAMKLWSEALPEEMG